MAAKNGCTEAARLLLARGAFIEAKASVCFHGTMLSVFGLIQIKNKNCGKKNSNLNFSLLIFMQNGMTPLHLAVWYSIRVEDHSTVKTLLEYNADCSAEDNVLRCQCSTLSILVSFSML